MNGNRVSITGTAADEPILAEAAAVIRKGGVIVYPTETIYGIGANALDPVAVEKVRLAKRRPDDKPILVIIPAIEYLIRLAEDVDSRTMALMETFWPGPLTLVLRSRHDLPVQLTAGTGTVGVRIPSNTTCLRLLSLAGCPLTSTSANVSGEPMPRAFDEIVSVLPEGINLFLDAGVLPVRQPSTVLDMTSDRPRLVRRGDTPLEEIIRYIPDLEIHA